MTESEIKKLSLGLVSLSVFRGVLGTDVMKAFAAFLDTASHGEEWMLGIDDSEAASLYGEFVFALGKYDCSFSEFLRRAIVEDENEYVIRAAKGQLISNTLAENAAADLRQLSLLTRITPDDFETVWGSEADGVRFPRFDNEPADFAAEYAERVRNVKKLGYGIFAEAGMFRLDDDGAIVPVEAADGVTADGFVGYESERERVFENTRALIEGRPAANVLLFGDAGTGKSSTVKACANMFYGDGVRLIELRRDQILSLSRVMGKIASSPLKFIIFIDDLSFGKNDDSFSMLKAALEGSASARAKNAVIYATSNRRHIVKESFSDREDDDIHHGDTAQELISLSDRFGLVVYFGKPDKKLYLSIVHALARRAGLTVDGELDVRAEAYALAKGNRSPRAAEQFIDSLSGIAAGDAKNITSE